MGPVFLAVEDVIKIHRHQIARYGGAEGIHNEAALRAAVELPKATLDGELLHGDLCGIAAAYLYYIVQDHPFVDGNKRTGAVAAFMFLKFNGTDMCVAEDEYEALVLSVATGKADRQNIADFLRQHEHRPSSSGELPPK